jgi:hypothetical protein
MTKLHRWQQRATGIACATLWLLDSSRASACDDTTCYLTVAHTIIDESVWSQPCAEQKLDVEHYPQTNLRAPGHFVRGVCLFERGSRAQTPQQDPDPNPTASALRAIDELQSAQGVALQSSQRMTAALLEGLLHCGQLDALGPVDAVTPNLEVAERRCFHRAQAKASFARVDLAKLDLRYDEADASGGASAGAKADPNARTYQLIDRMVSCQSAQLLRSEPACGGLLSVSGEQLDQVTTTVASEILPRYFDAADFNAKPEDAGNASSHVTAMLARKIADASKATDGSRDAYKQLRAQSQQLSAAEQLLEPRLGNTGEASIPVAVNALRRAYSDAILSVNNYKSFVEQFIQGLFESEHAREARPGAAGARHTA